MYRFQNRNTLFFLLPALVVLAWAGGLLACGGGGGGEDAALTAAGEKHFMTTCATCHGKDAMGLPKLGKGLHDNEFVKANTDAELLAFLKTGRPASHPLNTTGVDMPPKGGNPALTEEDLKAIVAYVKTLKY
jgi:disulfide bond formation protein DsbB